MNYDLLKTTLIEIIKEAANLDSASLERVGNTEVFVKKGRSKEFDVNAYFYYEHENNQKIDSNVDYITATFNSLKNEILSENTEYNNSKSYDLASTNKNNIERFKALKSSLNTILSNFASINRDLTKSLNITDLKLRQDTLNNLNAEQNRLLENQKILQNQIIEIKNNVNAEVKKVIAELMKNILINYRTTTRGTKIAFGLDGKSILENDKEEYDSLYVLLQILNNVKDDDIICVQDMLFINPHQLETVEKLLTKIPVFKNLEPIPKKEEPQVKPNDELIAKIVVHLKSLEAKGIKKGYKVAPNNAHVMPDDLAEYNNLLAILKILNKANNSPLNLVNVWDMAYVESTDVANLKTLLNTTTLFKGIDPNHPLQEQNQQLIAELEAYLDSLAKKISTYNGLSNLPIMQTKTIGDKAWVVLESDIEECNRIIDIISLLKSQTGNLINVWGIANLNASDIAKFKKLVNATIYFENKTPKIAVNETKINAIKNDLAALMKKAKENPGPMAQNGYVLIEDEEAYNILNAMYNYLAASNSSENLIDYHDIKIAPEYLAKYQKLEEELANIKKREVSPAKEEPIPVPPIVEAPAVITEPTPEVSKPVEVPVTPPTVPEVKSAPLELNPQKEAEMNEILNEMYKPVTNEIPEESESKVKTTIKKLSNPKAIEFLKEHKKVIIGVGLCAATATLALTNLPVALVYANSCNALATPALAGMFNTLSTAVASISGITFTNGAWLTASGTIINSGVAASKALGATVLALANVGTLGGSLALANTIISNKDKSILPEASKRNMAKETILDITSKIKSKAYGLSISLDNKLADMENKVKEVIASHKKVEENPPVEEIPQIEAPSSYEPPKPVSVTEFDVKPTVIKGSDFALPEIPKEELQRQDEIFKAASAAIAESNESLAESQKRIDNRVEELKLDLAPASEEVELLEPDTPAKPVVFVPSTSALIDALDIDSKESLLNAADQYIAGTPNLNGENLKLKFKTRIGRIQHNIDAGLFKGQELQAMEEEKAELLKKLDEINAKRGR